ncbi:MAG: PIN domain-containing protein [Verrucomicrobia bacterium]|nr:PIN domain-containing protein [Verrucomicrobiota bacterium]
MLQVTLDTSFLITFADPGRQNHPVAVEYYRHCLAQRIPMWISVVAAGEFAVKQPITDLPLQHFRILPYNLPHAIKAAELRRALQVAPPAGSSAAVSDARPIILNDLKIIAQAAEEGIGTVITEDESTLARVAERLRRAGAASVFSLLLTKGFAPGELADPTQPELPRQT